MLIRKNWETTKRIAKVAINLKVALFRLELDSETTLRRALATINAYVDEERSLPATAVDLPRMVKGEVRNIFVILRNKVSMTAYQDDIDTMTDMHHHIGQSAMNTPDLRLASLMTIQRFHARVRGRRVVGGAGSFVRCCPPHAHILP